MGWGIQRVGTCGYPPTSHPTSWMFPIGNPLVGLCLLPWSVGRHGPPGVVRQVNSLWVTPSQFPWNWSATLGPVGCGCRSVWTRSRCPSWLWSGARSHRLGPMPQGYGISNEAGLNLIFHPDTSHSEMDGSQCHKVRLVMPGEHQSLGGWLRSLPHPARARGHHT